MRGEGCTVRGEGEGEGEGLVFQGVTRLQVSLVDGVGEVCVRSETAREPTLFWLSADEPTPALRLRHTAEQPFECLFVPSTPAQLGLHLPSTEAVRSARTSLANLPPTLFPSTLPFPSPSSLLFSTHYHPSLSPLPPQKSLFPGPFTLHPTVPGLPLSLCPSRRDLVPPAFDSPTLTRTSPYPSSPAATSPPIVPPTPTPRAGGRARSDDDCREDRRRIRQPGGGLERRGESALPRPRKLAPSSARQEGRGGERGVFARKHPTADRRLWHSRSLLARRRNVRALPPPHLRRAAYRRADPRLLPLARRSSRRVR